MRARKSREKCATSAHPLRQDKPVPGIDAGYHRVPHWARFIAELLKLAGWPGDMELRPSEQRVFEEWQDALGRLASLGLVAGPVSWHTARSQLWTLLAAPLPQPGGSNAPVQILDPMHAATLQFDHLWITGMSHEHWQSRIESSPFIPKSLQAQFAMPGASPSGRRMLEADAQRALLHAAPDVVTSYSGTPLPILASNTDDPSLPRSGFAVVQEFLPRQRLRYVDC